VGNSILGLLGGGLGGQLLHLIGVGGTGAPGAGATGLDVGSIVSSLAGGGVGGAVLMAIVGLLRSKLAQL
jgi:hypothetical protein